MTAGVGLRHKDFDGYSGRLMTTMVLWRLQGLTEDDKYGFCGHLGRLTRLGSRKDMKILVNFHLVNLRYPYKDNPGLQRYIQFC